MDWMRRLTGTLTPLRVVWVTTKDDRTIRGVMVERNREYVILRAAQVGNEFRQNEGAPRRVEWTKMQGDVVIPVENVAYWQEGLDPSILE